MTAPEERLKKSLPFHEYAADGAEEPDCPWCRYALPGKYPENIECAIDEENPVAFYDDFQGVSCTRFRSRFE